MSAYLERLRDAIRHMHGCAATHVRTAPVKEVFKGQSVWEGDVEVFDLEGHPKAKRCYAWSHPEGKETRFVAVLEIPPVDSPRAAVQAAIASRT